MKTDEMMGWVSTVYLLFISIVFTMSHHVLESAQLSEPC